MAPDAPPPVADFRAGLRDILPLAFGVVVYGLAFGLLAAQAQMDVLKTGAMGTLVFAGAAQIVAVERMVAGAGAGVALLAGVALNLRLLLITASLRQELQGRPWWQIALGVHMATDENWALMHATRAGGRAAGYWYLVGGGVGLMLAWVGSTVIGVAFARAIPEPQAMGMDFAFAAAFIAILRGLWRGKADALPWLVSAGVVTVLVGLSGVEPSVAMVLAGTAGATLAGLRHV